MIAVVQADAILIAGPTASGKSGFALEMAEQVDGEIINADSMQVYPILNVLTARPPAEDLARLPHHLYGHVAPDVSYSVAQWEDEARVVFDEIRKRGKIPVFVGGTGLYFKALLDGLSVVPPIPEELREEIRCSLLEDGAQALHERLQKYDADGAAKLKAGDGHRIARALEVVLAHGKPLSQFHAEARNTGFLAPFKIEKHLLMPKRDVLNAKINARSEIMLEMGALAEVETLLAMDLPRDATILRAIGVSVIATYLDGKQTLDETQNRLKTVTRQYAKRQRTWFRNQLGDDWSIKT